LRHGKILCLRVRSWLTIEDDGTSAPTLARRHAKVWHRLAGTPDIISKEISVVLAARGAHLIFGRQEREKTNG
jgi:hypothetical protein